MSGKYFPEDFNNSGPVDANGERVAMGVASDGSSVVVPMHVDPITGALVVEGHVLVDNPVEIRADISALMGGTNQSGTVFDPAFPWGDTDASNSFSGSQAAGSEFFGSWQPFGPHPGIVTLVVLDAQPQTVEIQWSSDGINHDTGLLGTTPILIQAGIPFAGTWSATFISDIPVNAYYRLHVKFNATTPSGSFFSVGRMWRLRQAFTGNYSTLASTPTSFSTALLTRSVVAGIDPSGAFVTSPEGGVDPDVFTTTPLAAGGVYTSAWSSRKGYVAITLLVHADQTSATNGIVIQHSDTPTGVTIQSQDVFTYDASALANGSFFATLTPKSQYYRVVYTNGSTNQGVFLLEAHLETVNTETPQSQIESNITPETSSATTRSVLVGKSPIDNSYANVTRTQPDASGRVGEHVGIMKFDAPAPILPLTTFAVNQFVVTTSVTTILNNGTVGRKSVALKSLTSNGKNIYIGPTNGVGVGTGWELAPGESVVLEIDATTGIYAITPGPGSQTLGVMEIS